MVVCGMEETDDGVGVPWVFISEFLEKSGGGRYVFNYANWKTLSL